MLASATDEKSVQVSRRRRGLFLFGIKKTSGASLNAAENIKAYEKTKNADLKFIHFLL